MENSYDNDFRSINRFNNRIKYYAKYRPDYPDSLFSFFDNEFSLTKDMHLADIGSGTGLFSIHLLRRGYNLICVEPNSEMRNYAANSLSSFPRFISIESKSDNTGLNDKSIDCIFVAQAFHWMNPVTSKIEFLRILKPKGKIVICWILATQTSPFLQEYELLKRNFAIDYFPLVRNDENTLRQFYDPLTMNKTEFRFETNLDFNSLKGLLVSMSFIPQEGHVAYQTMIDQLLVIFNKYNINGYVKMEYELPVYWND